jgi:hypothetical protein
LFCAFVTAAAQTPTPSTNSLQAVAALRSALTALAAGPAVNDVTLTGTAERFAGSDDETGTVTYKALPSGSRLDLSLSGGTRSDIWSASSSGPVGSWTGPDGVSHAMTYQNLLTDPGWFPLFTLANLSFSSSTVLTYVGTGTHNGVATIHISASQQVAASSGDDTALLQHLTQVDIYLDATTLVPVAYSFNIHPDDNALLDIPVEVRYSGYQTINGIRIPLRVQKFVNNTIALDLQFQSAVVNSGISSASFALP